MGGDKELSDIFGQFITWVDRYWKGMKPHRPGDRVTTAEYICGIGGDRPREGRATSW